MKGVLSPHILSIKLDSPGAPFRVTGLHSNMTHITSGQSAGAPGIHDWLEMNSKKALLWCCFHLSSQWGTANVHSEQGLEDLLVTSSCFQFSENFTVGG